VYLSCPFYLINEFLHFCRLLRSQTLKHKQPWRLLWKQMETIKIRKYSVNCGLRSAWRFNYRSTSAIPPPPPKPLLRISQSGTAEFGFGNWLTLQSIVATTLSDTLTTRKLYILARQYMHVLWYLEKENIILLGRFNQMVFITETKLLSHEV
jgi:hypothetical protein